MPVMFIKSKSQKAKDATITAGKIVLMIFYKPFRCVKKNNMKRHFLYPLMFILLVLFSCKKNKEENKGPELGTCKPVPATGSLSQASATAPFVYKTADGWTITIKLRDYIRVEHDTYSQYNLELWGVLETGELSGNHENLNGKHLKDRLTNKRSIILPGGTKITMHVKGSFYSQLTMVSIYDGAAAHHINALCGVLEYSGSNIAISQQLDNQQADGETASFEISDNGLLFVNIYNEDSPGNKITERVLLGELFKSNPTRVNDYFDDPRLGHT